MSYYYRGSRDSRPFVPPWGRGRGAPRGRGSFGDPSRWAEPSVRDDFDSSNVLEVKYHKNYSGAAEILQKPKVLGSYSIDSERDIVHDQSMLHFLAHQYLPENGKMNVNLDLTKGCDKFNRYSGNGEESFQNFLKWIMNNQDCVVDKSSQRLTADFVSVRGNFTKIMHSPYNNIHPWRIYATEFKGSVYLINWKRPEDAAASHDPILDSATRWGHTFEHCMTGGDPENGIHANEEYRCVPKTTIAGNSLLYAPEVDCVDPEQYEEDFEDLDAFILVKCCKELNAHKQRNHRFKLNRWWAENQLVGIPRILVGYRNNAGIVHTLELLKTEELPEMAGGEWEPNVCFNFLVKVLNFMKERVKTAPGATFIFDRETKGNIYCTQLSGEDHIDLLPSWYRNGLFEEKGPSTELVQKWSF